jgi:hypothetical protein
MVAHLVIRDDFGITLASRVRLPNTTGVDWNFTIGDQGWHTQWSEASSTSHFTGQNGMVPWQDLISWYILHNTLFVHGTYDARFALGLTKVNTRDEISLESAISTRRYRDELDIFPTNLLSSLQGVLNPPKTSERLSKDNITSHFNATGTFEVLDSPEIPLKTAVLDNGIGYFTDTYLLGSEQEPYWLEGFPLGLYHDYPFDVGLAELRFPTPSGLDVSGPLLERLARMSKSPSDVSWEWDNVSNLTTVKLKAISYEVIGGRVEIDYTYTSQLGFRVYPYNTWDSTWRIRLSVSLLETGDLALDPTMPSQFPLAYAPHISYKFELVSGSFASHISLTETKTTVMTPYARTFDMSFYNTYRDVNLRLLTGPRFAFSGDVRTLALQIIAEHGVHWKSRVFQLMGSTVYAFHNAVAGHMQFLKQNYIEVLSELSELPELLPDVKPLVEAFKLYQRADIRALTKLGDFVAGNLLKYTFGIRPTIEVVNELNRLGPKLGDWYENESHPSTGTFYGKFVYPFASNETKYKESTLVTSVTTDLTYSDSALFQAIVTAYGYGVLPSFKSLWEVKSLSFVWDWFTNMSARFQAIDLSILSFMLRVDAVTFSHRVTTPGSGVPGTIPFDRSRFNLVYYYRGATRFVPHLVDTGIDFLRVQRSPNLGIFSSLLYVLTKGRIQK